MQLHLSLPLLALVIAFGTACQSTTKPPSPSSFASVTITNRLPEEIRRAAEQIFQADGFQIFTSSVGEMVFEKEGSRMNQLAYGGLIATQENDRTWIRVKANISDLGAGAHRLQCQAYLVPHRGDSFFEEEHRVSNLSRRPYQTLLDQVAKRLQQP